MKKLTFKILLIAFSFICLTFLGCQNDNLESLRTLKATEIDNFFDKVIEINLKTEDENVIYIEYQWDKENNTISILDAQEAEPNFFVLESSEHQAMEKASDIAYKVTCTNGKKEWSKKCGDKFSCGDIILGCIDDGGCKTICRTKMVYAPQIKTFYVGDDIKI